MTGEVALTDIYFPGCQSVTGVLTDTIRELLGEEWNDEVEAAWHDGLDAVAGAMMKGAGAT